MSTSLSSSTSSSRSSSRASSRSSSRARGPLLAAVALALAPACATDPVASDTLPPLPEDEVGFAGFPGVRIDGTTPDAASLALALPYTMGAQTRCPRLAASAGVFLNGVALRPSSPGGSVTTRTTADEPACEAPRFWQTQIPEAASSELRFTDAGATVTCELGDLFGPVPAPTLETDGALVLPVGQAVGLRWPQLATAKHKAPRLEVVPAGGSLITPTLVMDGDVLRFTLPKDIKANTALVRLYSGDVADVTCANGMTGKITRRPWTQRVDLSHPTTPAS